jgi:hypothetical protein
MMATLSRVVTPFLTAQSTASSRSSCILRPHCRSPAEMKPLPKPVEPRKFTDSTA